MTTLPNAVVTLTNHGVDDAMWPNERWSAELRAENGEIGLAEYIGEPRDVDVQNTFREYSITIIRPFV